MKKRTKYRLKNDLAVPFRIAVVICLFGAGTSYYLFHTNFFRALSKLDEEPIATITFKYKTAQRKFLDRVVWDRLRQNSPVYNGDTIHTAELSEATVWFEDGTTLDLAENTMAQVFLHDDGQLAAQLESGSANVDSSESSKGLTLTSSNVTVSVKAGSKVSAQNLEGQAVKLAVQKGKAELSDGQNLSEGKAISVTEDGKTTLPLFTVQSPLQNQKYLYYTQEPCPVDFKWEISANTHSSNMLLQISTDKDFKNIVQTIDASGLDKLAVNLEKGNYYWQLSGRGENQQDGDEEVSSGKIQVIQSLKPELMIPAQDYIYTYRRQSPSIRFIWSESETATAYNFEISKNPDMSKPIVSQRSSSTSIIISTLNSGTYYYQVTPYYVTNRVGLQNPSEIKRFQIQQKEELLPPSLISPANSDFINKRTDQAILSWEMENEPMTYEIKVSRNSNLSSPVISKETNNNYIKITPTELQQLKDGEYFWGVTQTDSEGNESDLSQIRTFYAINGDIEQKTIFPPDNYVLWKPLLSDTRFTWKTNLTFKQYFQLATDRDFRNIILDVESNSSSFLGADLDYGDYYWRITTKDQNFKRATNPKKISIVNELNGPKPLTPNYTNKAVVRPNQPCTFEWEELKDVDYYRIKIYKVGEEDQKPILDENFIEGNTLELDLEDFEEGSYRWEIQSFTYESETASRRSSLLSNSNFVLRKIRPVKLVAPKDGARIDGWDAIERPSALQWSSYEDFANAQLVLKKIDDSKESEMVYDLTSFKSKLPSLGAGRYEWTIKATTLDELDISAAEKFHFTVKDIPPFDAPGNARTDGDGNYNADYLRQTPYITFHWNKVNRASDYVLEIRNAKNKVVFTKTINGNANTSYKLENLANFARGDFNWQIKAVLMDNKKKRILIDGANANGKFKIDYNLKTSGAKRKNTGALYAE